MCSAVPAMSVETKRQTVTIYDVARESGASKSTVARVLSKRGYVAAETCSAVMDAVDRLGYRPSEEAKRLATGRFENVIDIFTAEIDYGVVLRQVKAIHNVLQNRGFEVSYHVSGRRAGLAAKTIDKLRRRKPRAIAACTWEVREDEIAELNDYIKEGGIVVCFGTDEHVSLTCDQVLFDEEENTYIAVKHLLEVGHRDIGFNSHDDPNPDHPRIRGMKRALAEAGAEFRPEWIHNSSIYEKGGAELSAWFLALDRRPTAMCINNDVVASVFVQQLARAGLSVPKDVSVIAHDDSPIAEYCLVPLTVATHPVWSQGEKTASMLCDRVNGIYEGKPRIVITGGELIIRESVARMSSK